MRISDWSSDVCSSDLVHRRERDDDSADAARRLCRNARRRPSVAGRRRRPGRRLRLEEIRRAPVSESTGAQCTWPVAAAGWRSEEHTSELQSLMRISYAVFCLKKKKDQTTKHNTI